MKFLVRAKNPRRDGRKVRTLLDHFLVNLIFAPFHFQKIHEELIQINDCHWRRRLLQGTNVTIEQRERHHEVEIKRA